MELTGVQRKIAFVVIVIALAGLGFYLLDPAADGASRPAGHSASSPAASSPAPAVTSSATPAGSTPAGSTSPAAGQAANIYRWLPFTPAGLTSAASVVTRFADAYGTFSYTESGRGYLDSFRSLVSAQLGAQIEAAYVTPGVAAQRSKLKQVSTGSSSINSLRAFGPSSLTFVVTMTEHITQASGSNLQSAPYAVTVTGGGSSWQVTTVELASEGNS
jgi:hypothetical protein